jgi:hypothetical protein
MSRITGNDAKGLMEAYGAVYAPQELTEEQVWEEVETWVNALIEEGYDLSDYTWEEMYESYLEEKEGIFNNDITRGISRAAAGVGDYAKSLTNAQSRPKPQMANLGAGYKSSELQQSAAARASQVGTTRTGAGGVSAGSAGNAGASVQPPLGPVKVGPGAAPAPARTATPPARPAATAPATPKPAAPAAKQTGDKTKDMATWAKANPKLAAAAAEKARIRGTAQSDNPLLDKMGLRSRMQLTPTVQSPSLKKDLGNLAGNYTRLTQNPNASKAAPPKAAPTTAAKPTPRQGRTTNESYDYILSHLIYEGYANTVESAEAIILNMSEDWILSIIG